ncbi:MAG TPA: hypothetical protein DEP00_06945 [Lachnospiraceae bacterium]|nr:hypothetical protein [Lachnospiraceae bacterium]
MKRNISSFKRGLAAVLCLVMTACLLAGCTGSATESSEDFGGKTTTFTLYTRQAGAEKAAGFGITMPSDITKYKDVDYRYLKDNDPQLLEYVFYDSDGQEAVRIRKAVSDEKDISGNPVFYTNIKDVTLDNFKVTLKYNQDDIIKLAVWNDSGNAYALYFNQPVDQETAVFWAKNIH